MNDTHGVDKPMLDWLIVGGGPHGVHLALRLLAEAGVPRDKLRIVDPAPQLLDSWRRCTANTGMTHLRSPGVHHLDLDPYSLMRFAGKEAPPSDVPQFVQPYGRPSLELFTAHCDRVLEHFELANLHHQARVTALKVDGERVKAALSDGTLLETRRVLLAVGASDQPRRPCWCEKLPADRVQHVFEPGFDLDPEALPERVAVVGSGITGAQVALRLVAAGRTVTMVARAPLRKHQFDSDPGWIGPKRMKRFAQTKDLTARRKMIREARHQGSLPPALHHKVRIAIRNEQLSWVEGEVSDVWCEGVVNLRVGETVVHADAVLLATGFESRRPGGALIDDLVASESLPCGTCGFPHVDRHLRWHPQIFVTGPLAELEVGPVARNLIGARRAAERIIAAARTPSR